MYYVIGTRVPLEMKAFSTGLEQQMAWQNSSNTQNFDANGQTKHQREKPLPKTMDINEAHELWGHKSKQLLIKTAKYYGVKLEGTLEQCEGCGLAMAKQKALNKQTSWKAKAPYERIFVDASGPHSETMGGNKYWFQAVDDFSRFGWCTFAKKKNEMLKFVESIFKEAKSAGYVVTCLRADGAGENDVPLKNLCLTWDKNVNVHYEGTSPYTPQQNGVVERRIALLRDRAHAQFLTAGLKPSMINLLWAEAINKVNTDKNVTCTLMTSKCAYAILRGHRP